MISATIEEFEQGTWVADVVSLSEPSGKIDLAGVEWSGAIVSTRQEDERHITRIVGGAGKLGEQLKDKYYDGQVSLQTAVKDIANEAGESVGTVDAGAFLQTYERLRGPCGSVLDRLAQTMSMQWWIGRDGMLAMSAARTSPLEASGVRENSDVDGSVILVEPSSLEIGGTYDGETVRHIRWQWSAKRFEAQAYSVPFIFRTPVTTQYDRLYSAKIDKQNGDGTVDVIAAGRFGVTRVPLLTGVPGSKIEVRPGEVVTLGFFGGDPQAPFCVGHAQGSGGAKVGRVGDTVRVTIPGGTYLNAAQAGVFAGPVDVDGEITSGTDRIEIGD